MAGTSGAARQQPPQAIAPDDAAGLVKGALVAAVFKEAALPRQAVPGEDDGGDLELEGLVHRHERGLGAGFLFDVHDRGPQVGEEPAERTRLVLERVGILDVAGDGNRRQADGAVRVGDSTGRSQYDLPAVAGEFTQFLAIGGVECVMRKYESAHLNLMVPRRCVSTASEIADCPFPELKRGGDTLGGNFGRSGVLF
jgi:hypothetical protein